jgi:hypothetical protein
MASGAATAGSLLRLAPVGAAGEATVAVYAGAAQAGELIAGAAHDRVVARRPRVAAFYEGTPGWRIGRALTAASLVLGLLPLRRRRGARLTTALLGIAGSTLTKTAVFNAGIASARDPAAVAESG